MTAEEFFERLKRGVVEFEKSRLRLLNVAMAPAFVGPLDGTVHYGVERSRLRRGETPRLEGVQDWLLVLDAHLLHITGRIAVVGDERTLTVDHRFYPMSTVIDIALRSEYREDRFTGVALSAATLEITSSIDEPLQISGQYPQGDEILDPEAVMLFAQHLAARRALTLTTPSAGARSSA